MEEKQRIKVLDPFTGGIIEVEIPTVVVCGTFEDCLVMFIKDPDPRKCAKFRGNLANEPEMRKILEEQKNSAIKVVFNRPTGEIEVLDPKKLCS